jgi:hypothetical protein
MSATIQTDSLAAASATGAADAAPTLPIKRPWASPTVIMPSSRVSHWVEKTYPYAIDEHLFSYVAGS